MRLLHGDFEAETCYSVRSSGALSARNTESRRRLAARCRSRRRARRLARKSGRSFSTPATRQSTNLQVGGGLRNTAALEQILDGGIARAVVGSAAVSQVEQVHGWLRAFGAQRLTLAFDVCMDDNGVPRVMTHGWQRQSETRCGTLGQPSPPRPLKHVLCTDVGRDGAFTGPMSACIARRYGAIRRSNGRLREASATRATCMSLPPPVPRRPSAARRCWRT